MTQWALQHPSPSDIKYLFTSVLPFISERLGEATKKECSVFSALFLLPLLDRLSRLLHYFYKSGILRLSAFIIGNIILQKILLTDFFKWHPCLNDLVTRVTRSLKFGGVLSRTPGLKAHFLFDLRIKASSKKTRRLLYWLNHHDAVRKWFGHPSPTNTTETDPAGLGKP